MSIFEFFTRKRAQKILRDEDDRDLFLKKYKAFRQILDANNRVLLTLADMQEKASGGYVFDRAYVRSSYEEVTQGVKRLTDNLNELVDGRYKDLHRAYQEIDAAIRRLLASRIIIPEGEFVLPLTALKKEDLPSAGGKFANLGELLNVLALPVPPGFVITTHAYKIFAQQNRIEHVLKDRSLRFHSRRFEELQTASKEVQELIRNGEIPQEVEEAITKALGSLCGEAGQVALRVAVRSSALHEDIMASFAGQYKSVLNVPPDELLVEYKNVLASQFTPRALTYFMDRGFAVEEMAMAVGVLAIVQARASGITYSRDPIHPGEDVVLVNAVWGLGVYAVEGKVPANHYRVSGENFKDVSHEEAGCQDIMLIGDSVSGTKEVAVPERMKSQACLTEEQILKLASFARAAEAHFGQPQDMEWALDQEDRLFLLQSRPLRTPMGQKRTGARPRATKGYKMLLDKGIIACGGVAAGPVQVITSEEDLSRFPEGAVLVVRHTHPEYASVIARASAVVSDMGTTLGHLATVVREYNKPAIFNTEKATKTLKTGMDVTVDALYGTVYEGVVEDVLRDKQISSAGYVSPVLKQLRDILKEMTPLNLTDPRSPGFRPRNCRTFHDITRFAHEASLRAVFKLTRESHFTERSARQLVSGVPLKWWVIDLEDGVAKGIKGKRVTPEQIVSIPMLALWEGMTAKPWKGPPPVDARGFLSVMFSATTDPGADASVGIQFADKNYILVARNFCNVSTRLGFHFSTIEAFVGDQENQNYISFVYTGGGADAARKNRRAALIARLLEAFDFRVEKRAESVLARIEGHKEDFLKERLKVLGHIIVHTRQMDMVMINDAMVDWYFKDMMKGMASFVT